ncbi:MAG TPA: FHA domain-containing protein [Planctomycetota bacterium]|jgi:hypothetical protein
MADIIITDDDLRAPMIDDAINLQKSLQPHTAERIEDIKTPFYFNPIFYYSVATTLGALAVWSITEPFYSDKDTHIPFISDYLLFGPVAGMLSLSIGVVYGVVNRNAKQAAYCGVVGMGVGLGATLLATFIADVFFGIAIQVSIACMRQSPQAVPPGEFPLRGLAFFVFMSGRGIAWSIISMAAGLGLGVALKSRKLMLNGFVGGMVGGLLGGMFFDPINRFITPHATEAWLSRMVGIVAVGLFVGIFIGIFENLSKEAWLLMLKGPLTGKQFILFKSPILLGSSPKSDVYLFKDSDIAALHARIERSGSRYLLKDEGSSKGTYVNGRRIDRYVLQPSDTITVGSAVLRYMEKQKSN